MKKENLIIGDYLYLRNGEVLILGRNGSTHDMKSSELEVENPIISLESFDDFLNYNRNNHQFDVMRVDRLKPCFGNTRLILETIWERKKDETILKLKELEKRVFKLENADDVNWNEIDWSKIANMILFPNGGDSNAN